MSNPSKKTDNKNSAKKQLDLYSYTGKVKFFDKDKGFGYIQEIPDTKNLKNVVKEWRITAEQLGNTAIHRGDFVYFMKHGKTIGEISPINLRDLLKTPCPECGRRDYVPGRNSVCNHCGHKFEFATDSAKGDSRDCGKHAWKKYGYHQNIRCRCCGSDHPTKNKLELNAFGKLFFTLLFFPLVIPFFLLFKVGKNAHNKL